MGAEGAPMKDCIWPNTNHHAPFTEGQRAPAWSTCVYCGARVFVRGITPDESTPEKRRWWAAVRRAARRAPRLVIR